MSKKPKTIQVNKGDRFIFEGRIITFLEPVAPYIGGDKSNLPKSLLFETGEVFNNFKFAESLENGTIKKFGK